MDAKNIKRIIILLVTSFVIHFSGKHLLKISEVNTLYDGFMVMLFFLSVFPFLSISAVYVFKLFRSIAKIKIS